MMSLENLEEEFRKRGIVFEDRGSREAINVYYRMLYTHVARKEKLSYPAIGERIGRNYSTAIYYNKIFKLSIIYDVKFKEFIKEWEEFI
jgi:hypothetical protein